MEPACGHDDSDTVSPRSSGFDLKLWKLRRVCFTADIEDRITPALTGPLAVGSYGAVRKLDGWNNVANRRPALAGASSQFSRSEPSRGRRIHRAVPSEMDSPESITQSLLDIIVKRRYSNS
jgi:hypothetical protein